MHYGRTPSQIHGCFAFSYVVKCIVCFLSHIWERGGEMDKGGSTKCNLLSRLLLKLGPNFFLICYVKTDLSPRT